MGDSINAGLYNKNYLLSGHTTECKSLLAHISILTFQAIRPEPNKF